MKRRRSARADRATARLHIHRVLGCPGTARARRALRRKVTHTGACVRRAPCADQDRNKAAGGERPAAGACCAAIFTPVTFTPACPILPCHGAHKCGVGVGQGKVLGWRQVWGAPPTGGGAANEVSCECEDCSAPAAPLRLLRPPGELVTSAGEPLRLPVAPWRPSAMLRRPALRCVRARAHASARQARCGSKLCAGGGAKSCAQYTKLHPANQAREAGAAPELVRANCTALLCSAPDAGPMCTMPCMCPMRLPQTMFRPKRRQQAGAPSRARRASPPSRGAAAA